MVQNKSAKEMWIYCGVVLLLFALFIPVLTREVKERKNEAVEKAAESRADGEMITIPTPGLRTIADLAEHMGIPAHEQVKTLFYSADGKLVAAVWRRPPQRPD